MTRLDTLNAVIDRVAGDGPLLTIQPGGNHGDSLIYRGCRKFFDDEDIDIVPFQDGRVRNDTPQGLGIGHPIIYYRLVRDQFRYARHGDNPDISAVYIHGGGNFNDMWTLGVKCFENAARHFDVPIIVGPQSVLFENSSPADPFEGVSNDVHFCCRERYSYDIMTDALDGRNVSVYLEDDTALYLDRSDLPVEEDTEEYSLVSFRADRESSDVTVTESIEGPVVFNDISVETPTFAAFVDVAARAKKIYTNRLHVAILATLLDKPVAFYENAYYKNRGVYEQSLSDCDTVEFWYDTNRDAERSTRRVAGHEDGRTRFGWVRRLLSPP